RINQLGTNRILPVPLLVVYEFAVPAEKATWHKSNITLAANIVLHEFALPAEKPTWHKSNITRATISFTLVRSPPGESILAQIEYPLAANIVLHEFALLAEKPTWHKSIIT